MDKSIFLVTCEHASNQVPHVYQGLFFDAEKVLESHEGWDPGALSLAKDISYALNCDLIVYEYSRLLIEVNRSSWHHQLFSRFTRDLDAHTRMYLINTYYNPYRQKVEDSIKKFVFEGYQVIHLSIHSFTPNYFGQEREVEIGLLFDPQRACESHFCEDWLNYLKGNSKLDVRYNQPYQGIDDGFTTYLRTQFSNEEYLGIELEVSQKIIGDQSIHLLMEDSLLAVSSFPHTRLVH